MTSPETDTTMKLTACSDNMTLAICPFGGMSENFKISALGTSTVLEIAFKDYMDGFTILNGTRIEIYRELYYDSEVTFFVNFSPSSACIIRRKKIYDAEGSVCKSSQIA
jgi:hypothetical protein